MDGSSYTAMRRIEGTFFFVLLTLVTIIGFCFGAAFGRAVSEKRLKEEAIAHGALKVSYDPVTGVKSETWNSR